MARVKLHKDPLTGEVLRVGKNEYFRQEPRDYKSHPLTPAEKVQNEKWRSACKQASVIVKDKSHPRYMELYNRWRAQLHDAHAIIQFPNFVRVVLQRE